MQKCDGKPQKELILENYTDGDLNSLITQNSDEFLEYIHKLGLHVEHKEQTINMQNKFTTTLTMKTTCFKVDFNDNLAIIAPLK